MREASVPELKPRDRVRNLKTRELGTIGPQSHFFPEDGPVRFAPDGQELTFIEPGTLFEVVGEEEPVADIALCGYGDPEATCIFLAFGSGPKCLRYTIHHETLTIRRTMKEISARRYPKEPWPKCQLRRE